MSGLTMEQQRNRRAQQTHERIRAAAHRLFLQQGYLATSIDAILAEASISSRETLYRHYASKEDLFVDVLRHLTLEQPGFSATLAALPPPQDLPALLHGAREQQLIADIDIEAVTHALLGGLLTYAIPSLIVPGEQAPPALERADALVEVLMRALTPP